MPGGGSHGCALTARDEASSSHPRLWFMGRGVTRRPRAGTRDPPCQVRRFIPPRLSRSRSSLPVLKYGTVFSSHLDRLAGTRIVPDAGAALLHREGAETTQLDALAASQSAGDLVEYRRHDQLHIRHAQMRMAGGKFRDEVRSGHAGSSSSARPLASSSSTSPWHGSGAHQQTRSRPRRSGSAASSFG